MGEVSVALSKLAGIQKAIRSAMAEDVNRNPHKGPEFARSFKPLQVRHYFQQAAHLLEVVKRNMPEWYDDFHKLRIEPEMEMATKTDGIPDMFFSRSQLEQLARDIDQIFEIRANSQQTFAITKAAPRRTFISHGRSKDWYEVQAHLEKDLKLDTLELAQEASQGQTIIEKLESNADRCDAAVIVMSGDDADASGQARVRENVMHEIGYFQGKYGRNNVVLLHEDGVSVPTNLSGIVYIAYPRETISATFGVLDRELKSIYGG
jgi:predicted nucleotide-binding protein